MKVIFNYIFPILILIIGIVIFYNSNNQFLTSDYLTFALILLTYFYVYFTWETLNKMKKESHLERRPYIISDFTSDNSELGFYVKNIGKTPAKNVGIKIEPDIIKFNNDSLNKDIFGKKIDFFPPKKVVETTINETSKYFNNNPDNYVVTLTYTDSFNEKFSEKILLDLNHHKKQSYIVEKDIKNIVESLEKLNKTLSKKNIL